MWRFPSSIRRWPIIHRPGLLSLLDWPIKKSRQLPKHPCNGAGKRYILYLLGAFILFSSDAKYIVRTTNFGNLRGIFYFDSEIEKIYVRTTILKKLNIFKFCNDTWHLIITFTRGLFIIYYFEILKFSLFSAVCHFSAELQILLM